jgi:hypothetical protein
LPAEAIDAEEIKKLVNQAMDQTRGLAKGLHPVDLDAGSLTNCDAPLSHYTRGNHQCSQTRPDQKYPGGVRLQEGQNSPVD